MFLCLINPFIHFKLFSPFGIYQVGSGFLMSSKSIKITKHKANLGPNAEGGTTKAISAGETEGDSISRHIQKCLYTRTS